MKIILITIEIIITMRKFLENTNFDHAFFISKLCNGRRSKAPSIPGTKWLQFPLAESLTDIQAYSPKTKLKQGRWLRAILNTAWELSSAVITMNWCNYDLISFMRVVARHLSIWSLLSLQYLSSPLLLASPVLAFTLIPSIYLLNENY